MVPQLMDLTPQYDVVVYPMILVAAAARARQVPHVSIQYIPMQRGSDSGPTGHDLGAFLNGLLWSLASLALRRATDTTLNTIVAAAGLPPWRNVLAEGPSRGRSTSKRLNPRWLRGQIERMLTDTAMQAAARKLGGALQKESGVTTAVDLIERAIGGGGAREPA